MAVKERPIIFGAESIHGILNSTKFQTRRVIKPQPQENWVDWLFKHHGNRIFDRNGAPQLWLCDDNGKEIKFPYGKPGQGRLWVRETWAVLALDSPARSCMVAYRADGELSPATKVYRMAVPESTWPNAASLLARRWRSPIYMPKWASRLTLEVVSVRVEQIQNISEVDAIAEGVWTAAPELMVSEMNKSHIGAYRQLWDSINGAKKGCAWADNPFVWCILFRRIVP